MVSESVAVVLGMGPTALSIVRGLGRKGVKVYGAGLCAFEVALSSRYCRKLCAIDPRSEPDRLCDELLRLAKKTPGCTRVLYPSGDESVEFVARYDSVLRGWYRYASLDPATADRFLNKKQFYCLCQSAGVPTITSLFPDSYETAADLMGALPYPCILKPIYYHVWAKEFGLRKAFLCRDDREYLAALSRVRHVIGNVMVQEVVEGPETNLFTFIAYIDGSGCPHGMFTGRKLRQYPPDFGTGTAVISETRPELIEPSLRIVRAGKYSGMVEVEYKWCARSRTFKAIEANIRPCRLGGLVEACGVNPLYSSFLDACGEPCENGGKQTDGVKWLFGFRDAPALLYRLRRSEIAVRDIAASYRAPRTHCIWAADDPIPAFGYFGEMAYKLSARLAGKIAGRIKEGI